MTYVHGVSPLIMIVEDNPLIAEFVAIHLQREKFSVVAATGCAEAVQLLRTHVPGLIILDIVLDDGMDVISVG
jgi:Response regulators consisting of a CheY-like receiver domain and a winged-helix DNA-binding domain